jgi:hypothetical protein
MQSRWATPSACRSDDRPSLSPTKSLEMGLYGHVTDVFTNLSELIHPNEGCSQKDYLKRKYN